MYICACTCICRCFAYVYAYVFAYAYAYSNFLLDVHARFLGTARVIEAPTQIANSNIGSIVFICF